MAGCNQGRRGMAARLKEFYIGDYFLMGWYQCLMHLEQWNFFDFQLKLKLVK